MQQGSGKIEQLHASFVESEVVASSEEISCYEESGNFKESPHFEKGFKPQEEQKVGERAKELVMNKPDKSELKITQSAPFIQLEESIRSEGSANFKGTPHSEKSLQFQEKQNVAGEPKEFTMRSSSNNQMHTEFEGSIASEGTSRSQENLLVKEELSVSGQILQSKESVQFQEEVKLEGKLEEESVMKEKTFTQSEPFIEVKTSFQPKESINSERNIIFIFQEEVKSQNMDNLKTSSVKSIHKLILDKKVFSPGKTKEASQQTEEHEQESLIEPKSPVSTVSPTFGHISQHSSESPVITSNVKEEEIRKHDVGEQTEEIGKCDVEQERQEAFKKSEINKAGIYFAQNHNIIERGLKGILHILYLDYEFMNKMIDYTGNALATVGHLVCSYNNALQTSQYIPNAVNAFIFQLENIGVLKSDNLFVQYAIDLVKTVSLNLAVFNPTTAKISFEIITAKFGIEYLLPDQKSFSALLNFWLISLEAHSLTKDFNHNQDGNAVIKIAKLGVVALKALFFLKDYFYPTEDFDQNNAQELSLHDQLQHQQELLTHDHQQEL